MKTAVVIPVSEGHEENLVEVLKSIDRQEPHKPEYTVLVVDGPVKLPPLDPEVPLRVIHVEKHEPGMEQPRNAGVRVIEQVNHHNAVLRQGYPTSHVWFLDSDIIVAPNALAEFEAAMNLNETKRILVGPYDWLPEGVREPRPELHNDQRWESFRDWLAGRALTDNLAAGLACFSGNLVWPLDEFTRIGGFWNELHMGRCEDGELGLRAVACGIPISMVGGARGWHLAHPENMPLKLERNERDVPMINERHPWVEGEGLFVVEEDGKRFNVQCPCGWQGNTAEIWQHKANCERDGWDV